MCVCVCVCMLSTHAQQQVVKDIITKDSVKVILVQECQPINTVLRRMKE